MPEAKVKEKSKLDHYMIVRVMSSESKVKAEMLNDFFSTINLSGSYLLIICDHDEFMHV